jgi:hypothetical protein
MTVPIPESSELERAIEIVCTDYGKDELPKIEGLHRFGNLFLFSPEEQEHLESIHQLIKRYCKRPDAPRPLSLAVFGAPGSGKSFAVKQILEELKLSFNTINLTQASDSRALGQVLHEAMAADTTPVIFFDEFDAPRDGAQYGRLPWFLAPMQDGEFVHGANYSSCGTPCLCLPEVPPPAGSNSRVSSRYLHFSAPNVQTSSAAYVGFSTSMVLTKRPKRLVLGSYGARFYFGRNWPMQSEDAKDRCPQTEN